MITRILAASLLLGSLLVGLAQTDQPSAEDLIREGQLYYARGDCQLAQYIFQEALKLQPDDPEALLGRGRALVCQGALDLGIESYQNVLATEPSNVNALVQLANAYRMSFLNAPSRNANRLSEALQTIERAEGLEPSNPRVLNTKGVIYYQLGDYQAAQQALEQAAAAAGDALSQRDLSRIQVNLGRAYRELDQPQLALTAFRRAVVLDPANFEAHNYLGEAYARQGPERCEDAIFELSQAANLNPSDLSSVANLGITLFECEQPQAALPRLEQAIEIDGVSIPALYTYLARVYIRQGRYEEAVQEAQKGALLPPTNAAALYWLGQAYQAAGNPTSAIDAYERALEIDPEHTSSRQALSALR